MGLSLFKYNYNFSIRIFTSVMNLVFVLFDVILTEVTVKYKEHSHHGYYASLAYHKKHKTSL